MALGWLVRALGKREAPGSTSTAPTSRATGPRADLRFIDELIDAGSLVEA